MMMRYVMRFVVVDDSSEKRRDEVRFVVFEMRDEVMKQEMMR